MSNLGNTIDVQKAREYARQDLPALLALCARLIKKASEAERESYAAAIAEEALAAKTINEVIRALAIDDEPAMRIFAAQVLQHCSPDDDLFLGLVQWLATDGDQAVAEAGFKVLGRWFRPHNRIYKLVMDMLRSEFVRSRQAAISILTNAKSDSGALEMVSQALKDKSWVVRQSAAQALEQLGESDRAVKVLLEDLKDENWEIRRGATQTLGHFSKEPHAITALLKALQNENRYVRQVAAQSLGHFSNSSQAVEALIKALNDKELIVRWSAVEALGKLGDKRAVEALSDALKDKGGYVRQSAALALGQLGDKRALDELLKTLKDKNWQVRQSAFEVLVQLGEGNRATAILFEALQDTNTDARLNAAQTLGQLGEVRATKALFEMLKGNDKNAQRSAAEAIGRLEHGDLQIFSQLEELATEQSADVRYAACFALKSLVAFFPQRVFDVTERNLHKSESDFQQRSLFLEMIGRCAFLGMQKADEAIRAWGQSRKTLESIAAAALLGELLPLKPNDSLARLKQLARNEDWAVREAAAMSLSRRTLFCADDAVNSLRTLENDQEIAVAFAASVALGQLTGEGSNVIYKQRRLRRYIRVFRRSWFFDRWLDEMQEIDGKGFAPFVLPKGFLQPQRVEELLMATESFRKTMDERISQSKDALESPRPSWEVNREQLRRLLKELLFGHLKLRSLESLERLLQLLPEPLVFYVIYKQAADEQSRTACCLFYELASLVEKAETAELFRESEAKRLRKQLPKTMTRLANGFEKLQKFEHAHEYAVLFSSLHHLLAVSSLSDILPALAVSEKALSIDLESSHKTWKEEGLMLLFGRLKEAVSSLRQYSEEMPLSLRTLPLSETIARLENVMHLVSFGGIEPYRTIYRIIFLQVLSNWRELLRREIRRLKGEAKLEFSTIEEVAAGEMLTVALEIRNHGPAPAINLRAKLISRELMNVQPGVHRLPSLATNESTIIVFTARNKAKKFVAEFVVVYDDLLVKKNKRRYTASITVQSATRAWQQIRNPYLPGKPAPDLREVERLFVGRDDVLRFIEENLVGAVSERIVVLYGHRRTGKTWTLLRLQERLPATYLPVYIDVQEFTGISGIPAVLQIFADEVLRTVQERGKLEAAVLSGIRVPTFEQYEQNYAYHFKRIFLEDVQKTLGERKLLWLIDEFQGLDDMVVAGNLPGTFMEFLRDLMQFGKKMAFIFAGTREMTGQYWSVFFNIAMQRKIGVLDDAEAAKLIIDPVKPLGVEHDRFAVPIIKQLTGNHPYFIQLLCDRIVSELNARRQMLVNAQIIDAAVNDLVINGASNLKFYWTEVMDEKERAVCGAMQELLRRREHADVSTIWKAMSEINPLITAKEISNALKSLVEKDLLEKDKTRLDTYQFKIGLVERYIGAHIPYAETQERIGKLYGRQTREKVDDILEPLLQG